MQDEVFKVYTKKYKCLIQSMWIITAKQHISAEVTVKCSKKCCIYNAVGGTDNDRCGMAVKRMRMLEVSVRKMKVLTVKMETVTLIGIGR
jgi:tryptophan synthase beta subunit